ERTRHRPLPEGRVHPGEALGLGCALLVAGGALLALAVEPLAARVTAAIAIIYLLLYQPLKRVRPLVPLLGAVPGALPPAARAASRSSGARSASLGAAAPPTPGGSSSRRSSISRSFSPPWPSTSSPHDRRPRHRPLRADGSRSAARGIAPGRSPALGRAATR